MNKVQGIPGETGEQGEQGPKGIPGEEQPEQPEEPESKQPESDDPNTGDTGPVQGTSDDGQDYSPGPTTQSCTDSSTWSTKVVGVICGCLVGLDGSEAPMVTVEVGVCGIS